MNILLALSLLASLGPDDDLQRMNEGLKGFQEEMLRRRASPNEELRKILRRRIEVPPPGQPVPRVEEVRPFWEGLDLKSGAALVGEFRIGSEDGAHISLSGKKGITASLANPELAFESELELETTLGPLSGSLDGESTGVSLNFGAFGVSYNSEGEASFETDLGATWWELSLKRGEAEGTAGIGFAINPSDFLEIKLGVEESLTLSWAEEYRRGISFAANVDGSRDWAASRQAADSVRLVLREPLTCPHCTGEGRFTCPQCTNQGTITCPPCSGTMRVPCPACGRTGQVSCPTTQACPSCGGDGRLNCPGCGGSGQISVMMEGVCYSCGGQGYIVTPEYFPSMGYLNVAHGCTTCGGYYGGVDSYGNVTMTPGSGRSMSYSYTPCGGCGGSGQGDMCGGCSGGGQVTCYTCAGSGTRSCPTCGGSGTLPCGNCEGTGRVTCPFCEGSPLECLLCRGERKLEPMKPRPKAALPPWGQPAPAAAPPPVPAAAAGPCTCGGKGCTCIKDMLCGGTRDCGCAATGNDCRCTEAAKLCRSAGVYACCRGSHQEALPDRTVQRCDTTCGCSPATGRCECSVSCGCNRR
jgi:hypothetical protein